MNALTPLFLMLATAYGQPSSPLHAGPPSGQTITVTPTSTEAGRLREECDVKLRQAREYRTKGDAVQALKTLDSALETATKNKLPCESSVLRDRASIYTDRNEFDKAIADFQKRLGLVDEDCKKAVVDGEFFAEVCAGAHYDLANVYSIAGKYADSLNHASLVIKNYNYRLNGQEKMSDQVRLALQTQTAEAQLIGGIAQSRLGKKAEAKELIATATKTLEMVVSDSRTSSQWKGRATDLLNIAKNLGAQF
jgi:tetratricopeptide (TPR) repeat protein